MIPAWIVIWLVVIFLCVVCWLCWVAYRKTMTLAILHRCIGRMCEVSTIEGARAIAETTRQELIVRGLWKSSSGDS